MEIDQTLEEAISEAVSEAGQSKEVASRLIAWFKTLAKQESLGAGQDFSNLELVLEKIDPSTLDSAGSFDED